MSRAAVLTYDLRGTSGAGTLQGISEMSSEPHPVVEPWNRFVSDLRRLAAPGVCCMHMRFEVSEVVASSASGNTINIFTILVAEEEPPPSQQTCPKWLRSTRMKIPGLKDWAFGVQRYHRSLDEVAAALASMAAGQGWSLSGKRLGVGPLVPSEAAFSPPDGTLRVPLNQVLRNNFWCGSHVLELADPEKKELEFLLNKPSRLQALSEEISCDLSLRFAGVSDRLGNIVIQIPVTAIRTKVSFPHDDTGFQVEVAWHPAIAPRPLTVSLATTEDGLITGYATCFLTQGITTFPVRSWRDSHHATIWDNTHGVLLAATAPTRFIGSLNLETSVLGGRTRRFRAPDAGGTMRDQGVAVAERVSRSRMGTPASDQAVWRRRRLYRGESSRLRETREFVQYGAGRTDLETRERALADLRLLVNQHGAEAAWLWDPFLDATDVLATLPFSQHGWADLRALTAGQQVEDEQDGSLEEQLPRRQPRDQWIVQQRACLDANAGDAQPLKMEFRCRFGDRGWPFHDRFLILRDGQRVRAWSLGTSVNSLGRQHHILQEVPDGQLIADAFQQLWDALDDPTNMIWKRPTR